MPVYRPRPQGIHRGRGTDALPARDPWEGLHGVLDVQLEKLRAELARGNRGVNLQGALVVQLRAPGTGGTQASGSAGRLMGWSLRETSGTAPATIWLRDGRGPDGPIVAVVQLAATASQNTGHIGGMALAEGLYVDVAGAVEGAVYLGGTD